MLQIQMQMMKIPSVSVLLHSRTDVIIMALLIQDDDQALASIKETTRARYKAVWMDFKDKSGAGKELDTRLPKEEEVLDFIRYLREEKGKCYNIQSIHIFSGFASSTMWATYSQLNAVVKAKYGVNLKMFPSQEFGHNFAFFGGLCHTELIDLSLERFTYNREGITISHS